jgi:hypothetical protein
MSSRKEFSMNQHQQSERSAFNVGQGIGAVVLLVIGYGIYGGVYWFATGKLYFGPWEWGLCLLTAVMVGWVSRNRKECTFEEYEEKRKIG